MKKIKCILLFSAIVLILSSCKKTNSRLDDKDSGVDDQYTSENPKTEMEKIEEIDKIEVKLKGMNMDEKIGQLIVSGFDGIDINDKVKSLIVDYKVSGFILFSRNIESADQTRRLLNDLKYENSNNDYPLFLSIDEEGGRVKRLPGTYKRLPTALKVASKGSEDISYSLGEILGKRVKSLGFNLNFAPVLDIYSNPKNTVIGDRAYGKTPEDVSKNGIAVMKGIRNMGVIPSAKHFPGHGDTSVDSHLNLPKVEKTLEEMKSFELKPFKDAIEEDIEMIMVAHILYPQIDNQYPSSMSSELIGKILRKELGFKGVVISDDMTMGAVVNDYTVEDATLSFLKAGGDIALICHGEDNTIKAIERIKSAVETGEISKEEVDRKVYRVLKLKSDYNLEDRIIEEVDIEVLSEETDEFLQKFE